MEAAFRRPCGNAEATFHCDQNPHPVRLKEGRDGNTGVQEWRAARSSSASVPKDRAAHFGTAGSLCLLGNTVPHVIPQLLPLETTGAVVKVCCCSTSRCTQAVPVPDAPESWCIPCVSTAQVLMSLPGSGREQERFPAGQGGKRRQLGSTPLLGQSR